jgi:ATP-dependent RNA circularization protein (DNA/RNA ligase family)
MGKEETALNASFFRFPHTPHLAWLGDGVPRDDKVLSPAEAHELLAGEVVVEEKLDGANLGISVGPAGKLRLQNRGQYLVPPYRGQFARAGGWLEQHAYALVPALGPDLILFGEWCAARHSIAYDHLPDWFLVFDLYDCGARRFWSTPRRDELVARLGLSVVPRLARRRMTLDAMKTLVTTGTSRYGATPLEGVVVRRDGPEFLERRAKLVRPDFAQAIGEHWRSRHIEWNVVSHD